MTGEISVELKVNQLEGDNKLLKQELQQMNKTLSKIETAIEKQNEIATDIRLLRHEFSSHVSDEKATFSRVFRDMDDQEEDISRRMHDLETTKSRLGWFVILSVLSTVLFSIGLHVKGD